MNERKPCTTLVAALTKPRMTERIPWNTARIELKIPRMMANMLEMKLLMAEVSDMQGNCDTFVVEL